jgi:hypothetical protein
MLKELSLPFLLLVQKKALRQAQDKLQKKTPPANGSIQTGIRVDVFMNALFHKTSMAGGN